LTDVVQYVSLFTIGHSLTLLGGVLGGIHANSFIIDAIIGFSVVCKAFDNIGGFKQLFGFQPNTRIALLIFSLFQGRDRTNSGADRGPHRFELLADAHGVSAACICNKHSPYDRRLYAGRLSTNGVLRRTICKPSKTNWRPPNLLQ
jgi:hypothetical protein